MGAAQEAGLLIYEMLPAILFWLDQDDFLQWRYGQEKIYETYHMRSEVGK